MISHKHKCIFVHIPKCGGSSLEYLLESNQFSFPRHPHRHLSLEGFKLNLQHGSLREQIKYYDIRDHYFSFTFVRNPWARICSYFFHLQKWCDGEMRAGTSFNDFVIDLLLSNGNYKTMSPNLQRKYFISPCVDWAAEIDFIGKIENFQEDFNTVCDEIGLARQQLPHTNETKHKHYSEYYNDEAREIVAEKYAEDISRFEYKFNNEEGTTVNVIDLDAV